MAGPMNEKLKNAAGSVKLRIVVAGVTALCVLSFAVLTAFTSSNSGKSKETENQYKETTVSRGDIVVGVTESGTATIQAIPAAFDPITVTTDSSSGSANSSSKVTAKVEELFVKAGQEVREGDPIARLSTDGFSDTLDELRMDLEKARISMQSAQLSQQLKSIEAENTLKSNKAMLDTADLKYDVTLKQLEYDLKTSQLSLQEVQDKIDSYEQLLTEDLRDDYDLDSLEAAWDEAVQDLEDLEDQKYDLEDGLTIGESGVTSKDLDSQITSAKTRASSAKTAFKNAEQKYADAMKEAKEQIKSLKLQYEQKALEYDAAQASKPLEEINAQAIKEEALSTADTADDLYEVEMAQMENELKSQQLSIQTIEKKIAALAEYEGVEGILYAPCSGLVMSVDCEEGDTVDWDAQIAAVANSANVYMYVSIAQEDISDITLGKSCNISLGAYEGEKFTGSVDSITVTPARSDTSTVSYSVKVKLDGTPTNVYEGMTGDVTFITKEITGVLTVSNRAVTAENGAQYVLTRDETGAVARREVETGFSDGRSVEVKSGLSEGDVVLIESMVAAK